MVTPQKGTSGQFAFGASAIQGQPFGSPVQDVHGLEPKLQIICKALQKRDATTRAKATDEFLDYLRSEQTEDPSQESVIPVFIPLYASLATDLDKRIRSNAHSIMGTFVVKYQKKLARYLPQVAPYWLLGIHDGDHQVSRVAKESFGLAFPSSDKQADFQKLFSKQTLQKCSQLLFEESSETFSDLRFTNKNDADAKYSNTCRSALLVLAGITTEQQTTIDLSSDPRLYKLLKESDASVQSAGLKLLSATIGLNVLQRHGSPIRHNLANLISHIHPSNILSLLDLFSHIAAASPSFLFESEEQNKKSLPAKILRLVRNGPPPGTPASYWPSLCLILATTDKDETIAEILSALQSSMSHAGRASAEIARVEYANLCVKYVTAGSAAAHKSYIQIFEQDIKSLQPLESYGASLAVFAKSNVQATEGILQNLNQQAQLLLASHERKDLAALDSWLVVLRSLEANAGLLTKDMAQHLIKSAYSRVDDTTIAFAFICHAICLYPEDLVDGSASLMSDLKETLCDNRSVAFAWSDDTTQFIKFLQQSASPSSAELSLQALLMDAHDSNVLEFVETFLVSSHGGRSETMSRWLLSDIQRLAKVDNRRWQLYNNYLSICVDVEWSRAILKELLNHVLSRDQDGSYDMLKTLAEAYRHLPALFEVDQCEAEQTCSQIWQIAQITKNKDLAGQLEPFGQDPATFGRVFHASIWTQVIDAGPHSISLDVLCKFAPTTISRYPDMTVVEQDLARMLEIALPQQLPEDLKILHPLGSLVTWSDASDEPLEQFMDEQGLSAFLRACIFVSLNSAISWPRSIVLTLLLAKEMIKAKLQDVSANAICESPCLIDSLDSRLVLPKDSLHDLRKGLMIQESSSSVLAYFSITTSRSAMRFYQASVLYSLLSSTDGEVFDSQTAETLYQATADDFFLRIAISRGLVDALSKSKVANLRKNRLISDLSGKIVPDQALKNLISLNALLGEEQHDNSIPRQRLILLIKTQLNFVTDNLELPQAYNYELITLITKLLPQVKAEYGSFWKNVIEWMQQVLGTSHDQTDQSSRYACMKLISWLYAHYEANDDLSEYWINLLPQTESLISKSFIECCEDYEQNQANTLCTLITARLVRKVKLSNMDKESKYQVPALISRGVEHVQVAAYSIQAQIIEEEREQMIMIAALAKEYEEVDVELPQELLSIALDCPIEEHDLDNVDEWLPCPQRGYFMAWMLIFKYFEDTPLRMRMKLIADLQKTDLLEPLLAVIFATMRLGEDRPADISDIPKTINDLALEEGKNEMLVFAARLYYQCLIHVPSLVRAWWIECKDRLLSSAVEQVTEKQYSFILVQRDAQTLQGEQSKKLLQDEHLSVRVSNGGRDIFTSYEIDEQKMEMAIRLPSNYPLRRVTVEGLSRIGVKDAQWRAWLLASQAVLTAQNGSILDAISLFQRNVSLHFEGVADCNICFSILSVQDKSLPSKKCQTCKNLFHSSCLFKWFKSSSQSRCPLCRTSFAF